MRRLSAPITRLACRSLPASLISPLLLAQCPRQRRVLQLARVPSRCHPTGSFAAADPPPAELHRQATAAFKRGELPSAAFLYELALHGWLELPGDGPHSADADRTRASLAGICDELRQCSRAEWALAAGTEDEPEYPSEGPHTSNYVPGPTLRNSYIAVRHGQSTANVAGIVSSDPAVATATHGLTELGRQQAAAAAAELVAVAGDGKRFAIFTSDFTRARETADILVEGLVMQQQQLAFAPLGLAVEPRLRERWFGQLDGTADAVGAEGSLGGYEAVWAEDAAAEWDAADGGEGTAGVLGAESVYSVLGRATELIGTLEADAEKNGVQPGEGVVVVLVAHGDVLQILQAGFEGLDVKRHRSMAHLPNASPRALVRRRNRPLSPPGYTGIL